jgi:alpha-D-xyloside xylohydrolase
MFSACLRTLFQNPLSERFLLGIFLFIGAKPQLNAALPPGYELVGAVVPEEVSDGIILPVGDKFLKVQVCADNIIRVAYAKDRAFFNRKSLAVESEPKPKKNWKVKTIVGGGTFLSTPRMGVRVNLEIGTVTFVDTNGQPILAEKNGGRSLTPAIVQGDETFHVHQEWEPNDGEALYGLGQRQTGLMNIKGFDIDLWQHNGTVVIPFLVSSRGYGILWDNTSYSRFGDLRQWTPIPAAQLFSADGKAGGLTGSYYAGENFDRLVATRVDPNIDLEIPGDVRDANHRIHPELPASGPVSIRWEGEVQADEAGDYLFQPFSNNGIQLWVDDQLVISHWRQGWLPWINVARVHFDANSRHRLRLEWTKEQGMETMQLLWKTPSQSKTTSLWSEVGEGVDYYFVYGPDLDQVIAGYRTLTGQAPMMPRWAFGLWQCRQRYKTQQESLDVLAGFRSRQIPIDNIVQDWFYWREDQWGSHQFDPVRFPDPAGWIRAIHDQYHAQLMISVWPKFYPTTDNFKAMRARGFLYEPNLAEDIHDWIGHPDTFYDAFNPGARKLFWEQISRELFSKKVDAWWMDASEPDMLPTPTLEGQRTHIHPNALGSGARMLNAYPLVNAQGIYEGQRTTAPDQRVFILTRSGFAGQQRYAAAVWSGDISSTWTALRAQITAGLGFCISGMPYWTMDTGGFSVPARFSSGNASSQDVDEWRELNARWFEFATFVPFLRVHGEFPNREMWEFGGESSPAFQAELKFDKLRYRLLPYIYSLAGDVTHHGGTIMRPLAMDFRTDAKVLDIGDQYMFGPALLVNPVTAYQARNRSVYLPQAAGWYDFWTGTALAGGQNVDAPAPYDALPIYVKAGSIIPAGPDLQYTAEKPADPITLYVYAGADGAFTLYEDDGLTYGYEKGAFSQIPISWNDTARTLKIGKREGSFRGMLKERTFNVVLVSKESSVGFSFTPPAGRSVQYKGAAVEVGLK